MHHAPCTLHLAPSTLLPFLFLDFIPPHLCVMQLIVHHYIFQCQGVLLWCTKILTEGLPLLFGAPFSMSARYLLHIMLLILPTNAHEWIKKIQQSSLRTVHVYRCVCVCAYHCAQLLYKVQYRTVLKIFLLILQTSIIAQTLSIEGRRE